MTIPPKKVNNSDPGTADIVGGNDWDDLSDYMNNIDKTGPVIINTETKFRDGKFKLRNPANTFDTVLKSGAVGAMRNFTTPVLTADDTMVGQAALQTLTGKTVDVKDNVVRLRENSCLIFKDAGTYYCQEDDGTITSNASFNALIQSVINAIPTRDDTVQTKIKIAPGDYINNAEITINDKYNLSIEGSGIGITRIKAGPSLASNAIFAVNGSVSGTQKNLTANITLRSKTATMASGDAATFAVGDWVLIRSTLQYGTGGSASGDQGEIKQIASIAGGVITFREPVFDAYATANTANIIKILPSRKISFSDFTVDRDPGYTPGASVNWWRNFLVDRMYVNKVEIVDYPGQYGGCMQFSSCTNVIVSDCHLQQNIAYNFQYGISFHSACQNCVVSNCTSHGDWRHPFEAGSGEIGTNEEGVCRNIKFVNCTATGGSQNSFDSHPEGEGIHFINCGALGTNDGGGLKLRSKRSSMIGCWVENANQSASGQHAIQLSDGATDCIISNCHVINCSSIGIIIRDGVDGNIIEGCIIDNATGDGISVEAGAVRTVIRNNVIINCIDGIDVSDFDNSIFAGNIIRDNAGYGIRFSAGNCTNNIITSNWFSNNTSGAIQNGGQSGNVEATNFGYP
jgi:Right handed beta helix region